MSQEGWLCNLKIGCHTGWVTYWYCATQFLYWNCFHSWIFRDSLWVRDNFALRRHYVGTLIVIEWKPYHRNHSKITINVLVYSQKYHSVEIPASAWTHVSQNENIFGSFLIDDLRHTLPWGFGRAGLWNVREDHQCGHRWSAEGRGLVGDLALLRQEC